MHTLLKEGMRRNNGVFHPFYRQLVDAILEKIQSGIYADGQMLPSERLLCLQYNVSRQTIRNTLKLLAAQGWIISKPGKGTSVQSPPRPPGETKAREVRKTRQIGFIYNAHLSMSEKAMMDLLTGLKGKLSQHGYSISLSASKKDDVHQVVPIYPDWLHDGNMSGYICSSVHPALQRQLADSQVPVVSLGYIWEGAGMASLAVDFRRIYAAAVEYVLNKGHERICALVHKEETVFTREVLAGYEAGRLAHNKSATDVSVERFEDTAYDMVASLRRALKVRPRITAVILEGEDYLDEAMHFFANEGLEIPKDLYVIAIQARASTCKYIRQITYFEYHPFEMARRAAEKLLELIDTGKTEPRQELWFQGRFIEPVASEFALSRTIDSRVSSGASLADSAAIGQASH